MGIKREVRDIKRFAHILQIFIKRGFGYWVHKLKLNNHSKEKNLKNKKIPNNVPKEIVKSFEELGGTFVKFGQLLSLRADMITPEYADEFAKLQDHVAPFDYKEVKKIIEDEFNKPLNKVFKEFNKKPIASASIGQVHEAKLSSGEKVAVKVQRPGIKELIETDIDIMHYLARLLEKHYPKIAQYQPIDLVDEFERFTRRELDYKTEARQIEIFYNNFKDDPKVFIPKVNWEHTTSRVLTMEYIEGINIDETKKIKNKTKVAVDITHFFYKQIFDHGFFHADPHPGNLFLTKNKKILLLDYGITGHLDKKLKKKLANMFIAAIEADPEELVDSFMNLGMVNDFEVDHEALRRDLIDYLADYHDMELHKINIAIFMRDALSISQRYKFRIPRNIVLLIRAALTLEGIVQILDPKLNLVEESETYAKELVMKKMNPANVAREFYKSMVDLKRATQKIPKQMNRVLGRMEKGKTGISINKEEFKYLTNEMSRSSTKSTLSFIIGALLIGSVLIKSYDLKLSKIGFITSGILSFILLIILIKHKYFKGG